MARDSAFVVQVYGAASTQGKGISPSAVLNSECTRDGCTKLN